MQKLVTAKSRHQCNCCNSVIHAGEKFLKVGHCEYVCELCKNIADEFSENFRWTKHAHDVLSQCVKDVVCVACADKDECSMNRMACGKVRKRYLGEEEERC